MTDKGTVRTACSAQILSEICYSNIDLRLTCTWWQRLQNQLSRSQPAAAALVLQLRIYILDFKRIYNDRKYSVIAGTHHKKIQPRKGYLLFMQSLDKGTRNKPENPFSLQELVKFQLALPSLQKTTFLCLKIPNPDKKILSSSKPYASLTKLTLSISHLSLDLVLINLLTTDISGIGKFSKISMALLTFICHMIKTK